MQKPKRRTVEIYFVLYLAALIFILPDRDDIFYSHNKQDERARDLPFIIQAEKPSLTCRWVMDSTGPKIYDVDSINTIYYKGKVRDVKFEFIIEGSIRNQKTTLSSNRNSYNNFFKLIENTATNSALFIWNPQVNERVNKSYLVNVIASGTPIEGDEEGKKITVRTSFSLNMMFMGPINNGVIASSENLLDTFSSKFNNSNIISGFGSEINLYPSEQKINVLSRGKWSNTIIVTGFNAQKDIVKAPTLKIDKENERSGGARITAINPDNIIIEGTAPTSGDMKVSISVKRSYDNKEARTEFIVRPNDIQEPIFADIMYPEKTYEINPKLPVLSGQTRAALKEYDKERASDDRGGIIRFTPSIYDTGKIFTLERYVDNELIGQKYKIEVRNYPDPQILKIQKDNDKVYVTTISFGYHKRNENFVKYLEIEGNATATERYGRSSEDAQKGEWRQTFVITPKNPGSPFNFKFRAVDSRGIKSDFRNYPQ